METRWDRPSTWSKIERGTRKPVPLLLADPFFSRHFWVYRRRTRINQSPVPGTCLDERDFATKSHHENGTVRDPILERTGVASPHNRIHLSGVSSVRSRAILPISGSIRVDRMGRDWLSFRPILGTPCQFHGG